MQHPQFEYHIFYQKDEDMQPTQNKKEKWMGREFKRRKHFSTFFLISLLGDEEK